ncbi:hypothetical protein FQR65_LT15977 [Abscondita terminalis]|nr:hypothetical protein FQR65_LT15977 [Abscondita terminalis]
MESVLCLFMKRLQELLENVKAFHSNLVKDNEERRKHKPTVNQQLIYLQTNEKRMDVEKEQESQGIQNDDGPEEMYQDEQMQQDLACQHNQQDPTSQHKHNNNVFISHTLREISRRSSVCLMQHCSST